VAEEFCRRQAGRRAVFLGTGRAVEQRAVASSGHELRSVSAQPLRGTSLARRAASIAVLPFALGEAARILVELEPAAVVGLGGYASGPVVLAAALLRIPAVVMEQNSVPGSTNRILAQLRCIQRAYVAFSSSERFFPGGTARRYGNPVRASIRGARGAPPPEGRGVLVLGGSQGARTLNRAAPEALAAVSSRLGPILIVHQTGTAMEDEVRRSYAELGIEATVSAFIDDMAAAYRAVSLVLCRAGATTVAELAVVGRPAVFVPFPFAIDDHQTRNAKEREEAGAAIVVPDAEATPAVLADAVEQILGAPSRLAAMAASSLSGGAPDAAARVVADLEELISTRAHSRRSEACSEAR
jgi:UDP-N-acetylglucosamine--N-acetylmuramyl-(pentapeptide) pyrophosphoryl-undecaprenol N-acetylglucosamine transferase